MFSNRVLIRKKKELMHNENNVFNVFSNSFSIYKLSTNSSQALLLPHLAHVSKSWLVESTEAVNYESQRVKRCHLNRSYIMKA